MLRAYFELHEMINIIKFAIDAEISYTILRDSLYIYPTMTEALNDILRKSMSLGSAQDFKF